MAAIKRRHDEDDDSDFETEEHPYLSDDEGLLPTKRTKKRKIVKQTESILSEYEKIPKSLFRKKQFHPIDTQVQIINPEKLPTPEKYVKNGETLDPVLIQHIMSIVYPNPDDIFALIKQFGETVPIPDLPNLSYFDIKKYYKERKNNLERILVNEDNLLAREIILDMFADLEKHYFKYLKLIGKFGRTDRSEIFDMRLSEIFNSRSYLELGYDSLEFFAKNFQKCLNADFYNRYKTPTVFFGIINSSQSELPTEILEGKKDYDIFVLSISAQPGIGMYDYGVKYKTMKKDPSSHAISMIIDLRKEFKIIAIDTANFIEESRQVMFMLLNKDINLLQTLRRMVKDQGYFNWILTDKAPWGFRDVVVHFINTFSKKYIITEDDIQKVKYPSSISEQKTYLELLHKKLVKIWDKNLYTVVHSLPDYVIKNKGIGMKTRNFFIEKFLASTHSRNMNDIIFYIRTFSLRYQASEIDYGTCFGYTCWFLFWYEQNYTKRLLPLLENVMDKDLRIIENYFPPIYPLNDANDLFMVLYVYVTEFYALSKEKRKTYQFPNWLITKFHEYYRGGKMQTKTKRKQV